MIDTAASALRSRPASSSVRSEVTGTTTRRGSVHHSPAADSTPSPATVRNAAGQSS